MNLTENQQQALLEILKKLIAVFWGPNPKKCSQMLQESFFGSFDKLAELSGKWNVHEIKSVLRDFKNADTLFDRLEEGYVRLFISDRGGVAAPLYESCYAKTEGGAKMLLMGAPAIDMKNRFESKGLRLSKDINEPPDHLSIEMEYLYFLLAKGWSDEDKDLIDEAATFAADVMLPWVSEFQARLAAEKKCRFYPLMTSILTAILEMIAKSNHHLEHGR